MEKALIKGMLGGGATRCAPPRDSVAWACFMLGERMHTGGDSLVRAGSNSRGAAA